MLPIVLGACLMCPDVLELGLSVHDYSMSAPEIQGIGNPVFTGNVQWDLWEYEQHSINLVVEHTSGVTTFERGYGLNTAGVRYRYNFEE